MSFRKGTSLLLASLTALLLPGLAATAEAQAGRLGSTTFPKPPDGGTRRFPSVTYDAANNAYLVTWSIHQVGARFVSADGAPLGSPAVVVGANGGGVRAACGAPINTCLIAWVAEPTSILGRFVRYSGGNVQFLSDTFVINNNGRVKLTSAAPSVVYSPSANEFLIAWTEFATGGPDVTARRISPSGAPVGGEIIVAWTGAWEGFPSATYNTTANEYVIAYYFESGANSAAAAQRVAPGSGALIGGRSTIYSSSFEQYPEIAFNSTNNNYLVITWGFSGGGWMLHGGLADGNIQPASGILPLAPGGGGDGIGLAYNPVRNTYFAVFQRIENGEVWGVEIGPTGIPATQFQVTVSGTTLSVQPRVAASTIASRWEVVASERFRQIMGQLIGAGGSVPSGPTQSPPPPPPPGGCTTIQPVSTWVCVNGNWLPPDHPDAGGGGGTTEPPPPPPPTSSCTTIQPVSTWVCVNGNWLPPDHPDAVGGGTTQPPPPPPPSSSCTTIKPASDWVCVNGNWLPPSLACPTMQPAPGWVCVGGNWLPPDHPSAGGGGGGGSAPASSCPTQQPAPGWVCVNGNWLPPTTTSSSSCTTTKPASNWVCVNGDWLPPDHPLAGGGG